MRWPRYSDDDAASGENCQCSMQILKNYRSRGFVKDLERLDGRNRAEWRLEFQSA